MARVVVIGGGVMGLAAAYQALADGHSVTVLEAAPEIGGMAAHFDLGGISTEKFYHFLCKTDEPTFTMLRELGIESKLHWVPTTMGFFSRGRLNDWGTPLALLKFPDLSLWNKLRYGIFAFVCVRRDRWDSIEAETAHSWIRRWCGEAIYDRFWRSLFAFKFYEYAESISAQWIWTRIRRIGRSRSSIMQEELGYLEGGSETLVHALADSIRSRGGTIVAGAPAKKVTVRSGAVTGVETADGFYEADHVLSTAPTPYISAMVPDLPGTWKAKYDAIRNIGVICVVFRLRRSVSPHFWVNIADSTFQIPGIIEFSNLRPMDGSSVVYVPYYMPVTNEKFSWSDEALLHEAFACLNMLNPQLQRADVEHTHVARLKHGQPICEPGFAAKIPPVQTPIRGLQVADTCFYYPEDRGIAESIRLGRQMAREVNAPPAAA